MLLEKAPFLGMEATGKCAGGIRYQFSTEINVRLSLLSLPMLERFEEELGQAIDLRWPGYLFLLDNDHDLAVFRNNVALQNRLGIPSRILAPAEVAARVPLLNLEGIIAAGWHDRDGLADPNGVVQGYAAGARRLGAQIFTEIGGDRHPRRGGPRGRGRDPGGDHRHPRRGQRRRAVGGQGRRAGRGRSAHRAAAPPDRRDDAAQGHPRGFPVRARFQPLALLPSRGQGHPDRPVQPERDAGLRPDHRPRWTEQHLERAMWRFPLLERAGLLREWAGLYEVTPDAHPVIDGLGDPAGFYVVAGFSGHGFMHGPIAGLLIAEMIADGRAHSLDVHELRFSRFAEGDLVREHNVV